MYIVYIQHKALYHIIFYYLKLYYLIVDLHKHSYLFAPSACCQQNGKTLRTSSLEQNEKHLHPKISRRTNKDNHFFPSEVKIFWKQKHQVQCRFYSTREWYFVVAEFLCIVPRSSLMWGRGHCISFEKFEVFQEFGARNILLSRLLIAGRKDCSVSNLRSWKRIHHECTSKPNLGCPRKLVHDQSFPYKNLCKEDLLTHLSTGYQSKI